MLLLGNAPLVLGAAVDFGIWELGNEFAIAADVVVMVVRVEDGGEGCAEFFDLLQDGRCVGWVNDGGGVIYRVVQDEDVVVGTGGEAIDIHKLGKQSVGSRVRIYSCVCLFLHPLLSAVFCL